MSNKESNMAMDNTTSGGAQVPDENISVALKNYIHKSSCNQLSNKSFSPSQHCETDEHMIQEYLPTFMNIVLEKFPFIAARFPHGPPEVKSGNMFATVMVGTAPVIIGKGGNAEVYLAQDHKGNHVVIKLHHSRAILLDILKECGITNYVAETFGFTPAFRGILRLNDEGIALFPDKCPFASIFDFVAISPGAKVQLTLNEAVVQTLKGNAILNREKCLDIALQLTDILAQLSSHKISHVDIKEDNLLLQFQGGKPILKVIDFGLSKDRHSRINHTKPLVDAAGILKCPWLAPELQQLSQPLPTSDLYSAMWTIRNVASDIKFKHLKELADEYCNLPHNNRLNHQEVRQYLTALQASLDQV